MCFYLNDKKKHKIIFAELMMLLLTSCRPVVGADRRQQPKPFNLDVAAADGTLALPPRRLLKTSAG